MTLGAWAPQKAVWAQRITQLALPIVSQRFSSIAAGDDEVLTDLKSFLPDIQLSTNPYDLLAHGRGESHHPAALPLAVVTPSTTQDVIEVVKLCAAKRIPIIPFGVGTSVEGHVCAIQGGISLDMSKLDSVELLDNENGFPDPIANVGAGTTRTHLNEELRYVRCNFRLRRTSPLIHVLDTRACTL